jgi:uncharacterized SAM-dependent methyltransferase
MTTIAQTALRAAPSLEISDRFASEVIAGLSARPKRLPPKYFYDLAGSALFERITQLPEYYPTRCEVALLRDNAPAIASLFPANCALFEFGAGSSKKARILLGAAATIETYVPVDISAVHPVVADFTETFAVPPAIADLPRVGFFPGSTIGNFEHHEAVEFLRHAGATLGEGAVLVIGVDMVKDISILCPAYNDAEGVTAKFNLNLLARINRELDGNFDLAAFEHHACYNRERSRIEMHLASVKRQKVRVNGKTINFRLGETIHTENSYKYTIESFQALAQGAGWSPLKVWSDGLFSVHALGRTEVR